MNTSGMENAIHRVNEHNYIIDTCFVSCKKVRAWAVLRRGQTGVRRDPTEEYFKPKLSKTEVSFIIHYH